MKKIAFSLLVVGLVLPALSLAQNTMGVSGSASVQTGSTVEIQKKELPEKPAPSASSDIDKLISPIAPVIKTIEPVINKVIMPELMPNSIKNSSGGSFGSGEKVKVLPNASSALPAVSKSVFPACYIGDDLMKQYDELITELQAAQKENNSEKVNSITKKIIELKREISASKTNCGVGSGASADSPSVTNAPEIKKGVVSSGMARMTKCEEVKRWEEKIAYYKKVSELADSDLKNKTNLSRDEIKSTLEKLEEGLIGIREQCVNSSASDQIQTRVEMLKPIGIQSAQEIREYYKEKIEAVTATENPLEQIQKLNELKAEKNLMVGELLKNKKEIQASELGELAKEIKIKRNEIVADGVSLNATGNKILLNMGSSSVSIVTAGNKVLIKDKNFDVSADNISITDGLLKIGDIEVKLAAAQVAEKLNIAPSSAELTTENLQPVYRMKVAEQRKLLGFIKMDVQNTQTADANSGNLISQSKPWYYFLTTK